MQARSWVLSAASTQIAALLPRALLLTEWPKEAKDFYLLSTRERFSEWDCLTSEQPWTFDSDVGFSSFETDCYYKEKKSVLVKVSSRCLWAIYDGCNIYIFLIISKRLERKGVEHSSVINSFLTRPTPDSCVFSWNETFINFTVENEHQISVLKRIFVKHFNTQILHGTLPSLSKKHSSAYRVEEKGKALLSHHLCLTEEVLLLMRILYRLSLRESIISVAWTDYGEVKHWIT